LLVILAPIHEGMARLSSDRGGLYNPGSEQARHITTLLIDSNARPLSQTSKKTTLQQTSYQSLAQGMMGCCICIPDIKWMLYSAIVLL